MVSLIDLRVGAFLTALVPLLQGAHEVGSTPWSEDLAFVRSELSQRHGQPWRVIPEERFVRELEGLEERSAELPFRRVAMELARIVALIGDGHTELQLFTGPNAFQRLPIVMLRFGDELRVMAATEDHRDLLGARVLAFGGLSAAEALQRIEPYLAHDNPIEFLHQAPTTLSSPEVLESLGASADPDASTLTFERLDGARVERTLVGSRASTPLVSLRQALAIPPYFTSPRPQRNYWFDVHPDHRIGFLQINLGYDQAGAPTLGQVCEDFLRVVDEQDLRCIVIDVRNNNGGDVYLLPPLMEGIARREHLRKKGAVFAFVGRRTFSQGVEVLSELDRVCDPIFVGEPSRGDPRVMVNKETLTLPVSGFGLDYSERFELRPSLPEQVRIDLPAPPDFTAFREGRDVAWETMLRHAGK